MNRHHPPGNKHANRPDASELIDRTLRHLGAATPPAGLENRIRARLANASRANAANVVQRSRMRLFGVPRVAFGTAAAMLACLAIVAGSVGHSRRMQPSVPGVRLPGGASSGLGAASSAHIATQPVAPPAAGHPRSMRRAAAGRAVIAPETQKASGVAVPRTPSPQP